MKRELIDELPAIFIDAGLTDNPDFTIPNSHGNLQRAILWSVDHEDLPWGCVFSVDTKLKKTAHTIGVKMSLEFNVEFGGPAHKIEDDLNLTLVKCNGEVCYVSYLTEVLPLVDKLVKRRKRLFNKVTQKAEHYYNAHANMEAFIDFQRGIKLSELE